MACCAKVWNDSSSAGSGHHCTVHSSGPSTPGSWHHQPQARQQGSPAPRACACQRSSCVEELPGLQRPSQRHLPGLPTPGSQVRQAVACCRTVWPHSEPAFRCLRDQSRASAGEQDFAGSAVLHEAASALSPRLGRNHLVIPCATEPAPDMWSLQAFQSQGRVQAGMTTAAAAEDWTLLQRHNWSADWCTRSKGTRASTGASVLVVLSGYSSPCLLPKHPDHLRCTFALSCSSGHACKVNQD